MSPTSQRRRPLARAFARWTRAHDTAEFRAGATPEAWGALAVLVTLLLAFVGYVPRVRPLFGLPVGLAATCFAPALLSWGAFALRHRKEQAFDTWSGVLILCNISSLHFFVASLTALSSLPGADVFAACLLFAAAVHGRTSRVTLRQPFLVLGTCVAIGLAVPLCRDEANRILLLVMAPLCAAAELYMGSYALEQDEAQAETERLRAAIQAQLLKDQERDVDRLSEALREVLAYNHDIKQTLTTAASAAELLGGLARVGPRPAQSETLARKLHESLEHIQALVNDIRTTGRKKVAGEPEAVALAPLLDAVRTSVGFVFPDVDIEVEVDRTLPLAVWMRGGATALRRVVDNLVTNACEGDGSRGAKRVRIHARPDVTGARVELVISDDGPGFEAARLAEPIVGLSSSKPNGTGLGLYTAEALVRASGGLLERTNHHEGGAVLRVVLPRQLQ